MPYGDPILVTGAGRSGTTLTMRLLETHGVWLGTCDELAEHSAVKRIGIYRPLAASGFDPYGVETRPETPINGPGDLRTLVESAIRQDGYRRGIWAFKDVKLLPIWPAWQQAFPEARWVVCMRDFASVVSSYKAFLGLKTEQAEVFVRQYLAYMRDLIQRNGRSVFVVWPERWCVGERQSLLDMLTWLDIRPQPDACQHMIDPTKWHHWSRQRDGNTRLTGRTN